MILADKIIMLRKKNGWSQEELAGRMNVSRQAVSKWEAAQSTPDLDKILLLARLFAVSTDFLLKDELEAEEFAEDDFCAVRRSVSMEEANAYLTLRKWASNKLALATLMCIISPLALIILGVLSESGFAGISENAAAFSGLLILFLLVAAAVAIFIHIGEKKRPYRYLHEEDFELAYGVAGMVKERQKKFHSRYVKNNILGTCLCIISPMILLAGSFTEDELILALALSLMLVTVAIGVWLFISVGEVWGAMERLLCEGEFSRKEKKNAKINSAVATAYWLTAVAVYLAWSFLTDDWGHTWAVWPIAGVLYPAMLAIVKTITNKEDA